jgi:uncharacterized membrane protein
MGKRSTASRSRASGHLGLAAGLAWLAALAAGCGGGSETNQARPTTTPMPTTTTTTTAVYTRYAAADAAIVAYCAGCHSKDGANQQHDRAYQVLSLDRYEDWHSQTTVIAAVLDKAHPDGRVMPPPDAPAQPTDAERSLLLDWTRRGAPDTPDGR